MSAEQLRQYCGRIGMAAAGEPTLALLGRLQSRHLESIPYENLDPLMGVEVWLEPERMFEKMILRGRGGYCFELNGLYHWLLTTLGYRTENFAARYLSQEQPFQTRRHRVIVVTLPEGRCLTDVGVSSESPRLPLLLEEGTIQSDGLSEYRFLRDELRGWVLLQHLPGRDWRPLYGFTEEPQMEIDYTVVSSYCVHHPYSPLNKMPKLSLFTPRENLTLRGTTLKRFSDGAVREEHRLSREEARAAVRDVFGIRLTAEEEQVLARLWTERSAEWTTN